MGARALSLLLLAAIGAAAASAAAAPTAAPVQADCGTKAVTVLFWPKGHGIVRSAGFPASRAPHLELFRYAGRQTYTSGNQLGFADAKGSGSYKLSPQCKREPAATGLRTLAARTTTAQAAVSCSFGGGAKVQVQKVGTSYDVKLVDPPNRVVLRAKVAPTGSTLAASTQQCRLGTAPK